MSTENSAVAVYHIHMDADLGRLLGLLLGSGLGPILVAGPLVPLPRTFETPDD
jgi:hypothetical protein